MPISAAQGGRPQKKPRPPHQAEPGGLLRPASSNQTRGLGVDFIPPENGRRPHDKRKLAVDWTVIAADYIDGKVVDATGGGFKRVYPTFKELEARYGIRTSTLAYRSKVEKWGERRLLINQQMIAEMEKELSKRRALDISDIIGNLDEFLGQFHSAVKAKKFAPQSIAEYDKALRLRVYALNEMRARESGAGIITIEQLQERHSRMRERATELLQESSGYVPGRTEREADGAIEQQAQALAEQKVAEVQAQVHAQAQRAETHLAALGSARQANRDKAGAQRASRFRERAQRLAKLDGWGRAMFLTADQRKATG